MCTTRQGLEMTSASGWVPCCWAEIKVRNKGLRVRDRGGERDRGRECAEHYFGLHRADMLLLRKEKDCSFPITHHIYCTYSISPRRRNLGTVTFHVLILEERDQAHQQGDSVQWQKNVLISRQEGGRSTIRCNSQWGLRPSWGNWAHRHVPDKTSAQEKTEHSHLSLVSFIINQYKILSTRDQK